MEHYKNNVAINVGINQKIKSTEKKIIGLLIEKEDYTAEQMASVFGVTARTVERNLASLQGKGIVKQVGSNKDGKWIVIQSV